MRSLTGDLTPGPPALDASTLSLGYRGGGLGMRFVAFYVCCLPNFLVKRPTCPKTCSKEVKTYFSAIVACSLMPMLKNIGITLISAPDWTRSGNLSNLAFFRGISTQTWCLQVTISTVESSVVKKCIIEIRLTCSAN